MEQIILVQGITLQAFLSGLPTLKAKNFTRTVPPPERAFCFWDTTGTDLRILLLFGSATGSGTVGSSYCAFFPIECEMSQERRLYLQQIVHWLIPHYCTKCFCLGWLDTLFGEGLGFYRKLFFNCKDTINSRYVCVRRYDGVIRKVTPPTGVG
jgi:hypothetical protein